MKCELIKKQRIIKTKDSVKSYTNYYLVVEGIETPIAIEPHKYGKSGKSTNKILWKLATEELPEVIDLTKEDK